ncbi:MAG: ATP-dependent RNA helicase HrpA [Opitutales bacterium]|nr:ATP-dependent RNA helicase HrpA [Opitutales bacterium]
MSSDTDSSSAPPAAHDLVVRDALWLQSLGRAPRGGGERARLFKSARRVEGRRAAVPPVRYPEDLPVSMRAAEIRDLLTEHPVVIVAGETGSGKTTQLPKICLEAGFGARGMIGCTQPRRVAALSVSRRIAEELGVQWGHEVGAKIRFTDRTSDATLIKLATDGMLLSEVQSDPLLSAYEVIIVDEAHERSLNIDFLLGYLARLRARRPDLRVIITSATIDTAAFAAAFRGAPVVEVTGRTYPVDVIYAPVDEILEESGEVTYIDAAARAVEDVVLSREPGDVLVFFPGERDIRETRDLLEGRIGNAAEIIMLFGRLSSGEQDRIFKASNRRKVILATNIAETSLTIPGIRTVIDTGLARISRYSSGANTRRLPIEKIAQSSAEQRRGRAGRVGPGTCVRLYEERDFLARPEYTTPEIQRANLADVILRMVALRLGKVEDFPFLDPPQPRAVKAGYQLLRDLGALDADDRLTAVGKRLARLPCDPTIGRMLLEAQKEGSLREVMVIAAALSIQDPRERPADKAAEADRMHRRFVHEESDFLTLLNIWNACNDETERMSQRQMRRFCKDHFLNYLRMREWRDVHQQLLRVLEDDKDFRLNAEPAEYPQIHRALLSGLLMNVACREENNHYRGTRNRRAIVFPGSGLFDKRARKLERRKGAPKPKPSGDAPVRKSPAWILCGEWMETGRLYARTVARIEPRWILELGAHLLKSSYSEPWYDEKGERVLVKERRQLYGLEIDVRAVGFGRVDPRAATEIFVREALVEGSLQTRFPFHEANEAVRKRVGDMQTRLRHAGAFALDQRVYEFYVEKFADVSGAADLHAYIRAHGDKTLRMEEKDLLPGGGDEGVSELYPDAVELAGSPVSLEYRYEPGAEEDGATLRVPVGQFDAVDAAALDWVVPGYVRQRVDALLRSLPKEHRRGLFPLADRVEELTRLVRPGPEPLHRTLAALIRARHGMDIPEGAWDLSGVPAHLRPRVEVLDAKGRLLAAGRDWEAVRVQYAATVRDHAARGEGNTELTLWKAARERHERASVDEKSFPDLPERLPIGDIADVPVHAWPGLRVEGSGVALRLFPNPAEAETATAPALRQLLARAFGRDLAWLERDLAKTLKRVELLAVGTASKHGLSADAARHMENHFFEGVPVLPLSRKAFAAALTEAKARSKAWVPRFVDLLEAILQRRLALANSKDPLARETAARLFPQGFLRGVPHRWLVHYPRYLDAHDRRVQRARLDPRRDAQRAAAVDAFVRRLAALPRAAVRELFWLVEEFRVSVFAQDLGTSLKVSPARLDNAFAEAEKPVTPRRGAV